MGPLFYTKVNLMVMAESRSSGNFALISLSIAG